MCWKTWPYSGFIHRLPSCVDAFENRDLATGLSFPWSLERKVWKSTSCWKKYFILPSPTPRDVFGFLAKKMKKISCTRQKKITLWDCRKRRWSCTQSSQGDSLSSIKSGVLIFKSFLPPSLLWYTASNKLFNKNTALVYCLTQSSC